MGFGSYYVSSPGWCFSTEHYKEYINEPYHNDNVDDGKIILDWFFYFIVMNVKYIWRLKIINVFIMFHIEF